MESSRPASCSRAPMTMRPSSRTSSHVPQACVCSTWAPERRMASAPGMWTSTRRACRPLPCAWQMTDDDGYDGGFSLVGTPTPRSARREQDNAAPPRGGFRVVDGGSSQGGGRPSSSRQQGRVTTDSSGRRRIDLGPSATERLRGSGGGRRSSDRGNRYD